MSRERVLVVLPTYNEATNIEAVVRRIGTALPDVHVLVVDDNSPDGTGELADKLAADHSGLQVLHRAGKGGLGQAYVAGFGWGLQTGYDVLVQMDADGSHLPEQLPTLLTALRGADLVIGSRWVPGGTVVNWPRSRRLLSRGGNRYTRLAMGLGVHDATGGFRAWRRTALEAVDLAGVASQGYCFQVDLTRRAVHAGLQVVEVPIRFVERVTGESKMSNAVVREAMLRVTVWGARDRLRQARRALGAVRLPGRGH